MSDLNVNVVLHAAPELEALLRMVAPGAPLLHQVRQPSIASPAPVPVQAAAMPPAAPPVAAPVQQAPPQIPVAPPPVTERTYALEELSRAGAALLDSGKGAEAVALLGQFGIKAMTELPQERYGEYATALRGLGAKI